MGDSYESQNYGSKEDPKRASDHVRGKESGHPWKTGESIHQHDGNDAVLDAGKPEPRG